MVASAVAWAAADAAAAADTVQGWQGAQGMHWLVVGTPTLPAALPKAQATAAPQLQLQLARRRARKDPTSVADVCSSLGHSSGGGRGGLADGGGAGLGNHLHSACRGVLSTARVSMAWQHMLEQLHAALAITSTAPAGGICSGREVLSTARPQHGVWNKWVHEYMHSRLGSM